MGAVFAQRAGALFALIVMREVTASVLTPLVGGDCKRCLASFGRGAGKDPRGGVQAHPGGQCIGGYTKSRGG